MATQRCIFPLKATSRFRGLEDEGVSFYRALGLGLKL